MTHEAPCRVQLPFFRAEPPFSSARILSRGSQGRQEHSLPGRQQPPVAPDERLLGQPELQRQGQGEGGHPGTGEPVLRITRKKKTRRGGKGRFKNKTVFKTCDTWKVFHTNIRGFQSKQESLKSIIQQIQPNVITINETALKNNKRLKN